MIFEHKCKLLSYHIEYQIYKNVSFINWVEQITLEYCKIYFIIVRDFTLRMVYDASLKWIFGLEFISVHTTMYTSNIPHVDQIANLMQVNWFLLD